MEVFLFVMELIGTAAFAVSGAMTALRKHMDVFGVCMLGVTAACGGGLLRDVFLGALPPVLFRAPVYALTAVAVSVLVFLPAVRRWLVRHRSRYEQILLAADAVGLGVFTAAGVLAAVRAGFGDHDLFFAVFLGTITGVGGGLLRDVLAGDPPYIFVKHIYACASILGAILCYALRRSLGETAALLLCCTAVIAVRLLAARFRWSLPKATEMGPEEF